MPADTRIRRKESVHQIRRKESVQPEEDTDSTPYRITGAAVKKYVLSFCVLYTVLAVSIFSVFALQGQAPTFVKGTLEGEVEPGEEVTFSISLKNPSILGREFTLILEKDIPLGWVASFCDGTQCFYEECTDELQSLEEREFTVNVITDTVDHAGTLQLMMYYDGTIQEIVDYSVKTTKKAQFTAELLEDVPDQDGAAFRVKITNTGNVPDVYTVFVPSGVTASVTEDTIELEPGHEKEVAVHIEEKGSINTSVVVTSQSGLSETLYLICERHFTYDFELYSPREFYIDQSEAEITVDIINMGDVTDVYTVSATCLSPGWEVHCYHETVSVDPKKSERIKVWIKRGEGKSTSVIVTATSESGLSKNAKLNVFLQETQGKTVLAEYFTGTWCYVCSYGERALRQLAEEFEDLVVLVYHLKDEIETPGSQKRAVGLYGFTDNVSTLVINGNKHLYYSTGGEGTIYFKYKNIIQELLSEMLKVEIYTSGHTVQNTAYVTAEIHSYIQGTYDVYFVLFKNDFEYRGETKQYIVRDVSDPIRITLTEEGTMVSCEFELPPGDSFEGYGVVVIVQNYETLEVIQANSYML